jgi:hypothetical protein
MKAANLALRFALELAAIAALVCWGLETGSTALVGILLGVAATALFVTVWGRWIAPKAGHRLEDPARLVAELFVFAVSTAALAATGRTGLAIAFAVLIAINELLLGVWGQRETA